MSQLKYLPFQIYGRKAEHGLGNQPEGFYLVKVVDASQSETKQSEKMGSYQQRLYKSQVIMGPNAGMEWAGKPFFDRIPETEQFAGRHMELFAACYGSEDAVNAVAQGHNGQFAPEMCHGYCYIAEVVINKAGYPNVSNRYPANEAQWKQLVGDAQQGTQPGGMLQPPPPAPAPSFAPPVPPAAPGFPSAPAAAPGFPTAPGFPQPGGQPQPAFTAPAPVPPPAAPMPSAPGFPVPPAVPGVPAR